MFPRGCSAPGTVQGTGDGRLGGRSTVGNSCPGMALGIYREIVALHRKIQRHLELVGADFSPLIAEGWS